MKDRIVEKIVWLLPRSIVYGCGIRLAAYATCGRWSHVSVSDLKMVDALKRWREGGKI